MGIERRSRQCCEITRAATRADMREELLEELYAYSEGFHPIEPTDGMWGLRRLIDLLAGGQFRVDTEELEKCLEKRYEGRFAVEIRKMFEEAEEGLHPSDLLLYPSLFD